MSDYTENPELPPAERETRDVGAMPIIIGLSLVVLVALLLGVASLWLFPGALRDIPRRISVSAFPAPRLQPAPPRDMAAFYAEEMQRLHGTGWVDRAQGIIHIPIEDAMRLVAARGIADWPKQPLGQVTR